MKRYIIVLCLLIGLQGLDAQTLKVMSYNIHIGKNAAGEDQLKNVADFNAEPGTKEIINLENIFKDITPQSALTYPAVKPLKKIDYIMVDKRHLAKIVKQEVLSVDYSDHQPVMSVVKFRRINSAEENSNKHYYFVRTYLSTLSEKVSLIHRLNRIY